MDPQKLRKAIRCASEFLKEAKKVEIHTHIWERSKTEYCEQGKQSATVKRRSMDLTNALADLRK